MDARGLAVLAVLAGFVAGLGVAGAMGVGPLAYISYTVRGGSGGGNGTIVTVPVNLTLGELEPGEQGVVNGTFQVTVSSNGTYEVELTHEGMLKRVFAGLEVRISVAGQNVTLSLYGDDDQEIYLPAGTYTGTITVSYVVKDNPASQTVQHAPLVIITSNGHDHDSDRS